MREFPYITIGKIIEDINVIAKKKRKTNSSFLKRPTYYSLEKKLNLPKGKRTASKTHWRVYSIAEYKTIIKKIIKNYNLE